MIQKFIVALLGATMLLASCKTDKKTEANAETADPYAPKKIILPEEPAVPYEGAATFVVTGGVVYWQGKKANGDFHNGLLKISGGELLVNQGRLLEGKVTLDMTSIEVSDIQDPADKADLEDHLKNADFFETNKYPTAEYTIEEVLPSQMPDFNRALIGSLTMKGKTEKVNIPLRLNIEGNTLTAESATFFINRTKWGVNFHAGILGTAKDKLIDDTVPIALKLTAKAK